MVGDVNGAQDYATTAKRLNIAAVIVSIVSFIVLIIVISQQK